MSNYTSPLPSASSDDTKTCPYCAETIKAAATVCRYCGKELPPVGAALGQPNSPQRQAAPAVSATAPPQKKSRWPMALVGLGVLLFAGSMCSRVPATTSRTTITGSAAAGKAAVQPTFTATAQPGTAEAGKAGAAAPLAELATATPEPPTLEPTAPGPIAFQKGEDVTLGNLRWNVLQAVAEGQALRSDNQFVDDATTAGSFNSSTTPRPPVPLYG